MHVELDVSSRIDLWQLIGSIEGTKQAEMVEKLLPAGAAKTFRRQQGAGIETGASEQTQDTTSTDNQLTIETLRAGQNLASSKLPFLLKLHQVLDDVEKTGDDHIISWLPHGRGFRVHRPKAFVREIIPHYFKQSKYKSFQRQLHLYEFVRTQRGAEAGAYSHPKFIRGQRRLCLSLSPKKIKGNIRRPLNSLHVDTHSNTGAAVTHQKNNVLLPSTYQERYEPSKSLLRPLLSSSLRSNLGDILVTGASLAEELERKKQRLDEVSTPHSGDVVYVFEGMPFRYMENETEHCKPFFIDGSNDDDSLFSPDSFMDIVQ